MRAFAAALALAALGCATTRPPRCRVVDVPMFWADGAVTTWRLTVCDARPRE